MKRAHIPAAVMALSVTAVRAQWTTETWQLQPGWNAIYALNDCSHASIDTLFAAYPSVTKIWRWMPSNLTSQFIANPEVAVEGQEWKTWVRGTPANTTMTTLLPNYGYLVYVTGTSNLTLPLTGKAILTTVDWRSSGSNLVGFPAATGASAPKFGGTTSGYFAPLAGLGYNPSTTQIYQYTGGEISGTNPQRVSAPTNATVIRGKAYWVNLAVYTDFASPVKVETSSPGGLDFGTSGGPQRLMVTNTSAAQITVTLTPSSSDTPPAGQPAVTGQVPLQMRQWNATTLAYEYVDVPATLTATLAAGARAEWTLVPKRAAMTAAAGALYATVLRITDSGAHGNYSSLTVPVTAQKGSLGGLWVGEATIGQVQNQLQRFVRNPDGTNVLDENGHFIPDGAAETSNTATAQQFRLRLIVHVDAAGAARLLSNVYYGALDAAPTTKGFTTIQSALYTPGLPKAVRITATHLPLDLRQALTGSFGAGGSLTTSVVLDYKDPTNPFLHTYHPDHDNLDPRFNATPLPEGRESHTVTRAITLALHAAAPAPDPAWGVTLLTGSYTETITGLHKNSIATAGTFQLRRLSPETTLVP
jgi:hypothetical protein